MTPRYTRPSQAASAAATAIQALNHLTLAGKPTTPLFHMAAKQ